MYETNSRTAAPRDLERQLIDRCLEIARSIECAPQCDSEANICHLAAMLLASKKPRDSVSLHNASENYFADRPDAKLSIEQVLALPGILGLSRFAANLNKAFSGIRV